MQIYVLFFIILDIVNGDADVWFTVVICFGVLISIVSTTSFVCWKKYCRKAKVCHHCSSAAVIQKL